MYLTVLDLKYTKYEHQVQGWVQFHMELGIEVINSNYTGIGIGIGIEIIFNPRIGIGIEYFLEKVIGIDQSNWCI